MISEILTGLIFLASIASLVLAIVLHKKNKKNYHIKDVTSVHKDEIKDYNLISVQERPLNELIQKDKTYSDIIFLGIKGYDSDSKCNIIMNDCDSKNQLILPSYNEI